MKKVIAERQNDFYSLADSFSIDYWNPLLIDVANSSSSLYFELDFFSSFEISIYVLKRGISIDFYVFFID